jgi:hypothetical protein
MAGQDVMRFMNAARVRLPGATDDAMQLELFAMLDEFFKDSNCWMEDIPIDVTGTDPPGTVYYVVPSTPSVIDKLMWVFTLPPDGNVVNGTPTGADMQIPGELTLHTQPSSNVTCQVTVALTVQDPIQKDGYVSFPSWILAKYRNGLLDGLLGRMMSQPNKPFSNTQLSIYHMRMFNRTKALARIDTQRMNTFRRQAWVFPRTVGGSQKGRGYGSYVAPQ